MSNKKEIIIKATKLKKSFLTGDTEQTIFENLDLNIYKGDFTVIMGSSGAGKSTLMYSLSGMDRPTSGEVVWAGRAITSLNDDKLAIFRRKNCGFVFQQIYLLDKMSLMDKNYGFNVWNEESTEIEVFEGAIDLMSYADIYSDFHSNKLALGMLSDAPLVTFLKEHPQITTIKFCLDNDKPGRTETEQLMQKYYELGYEVEDCPPPKNYKDYNQWMKEARKENLQIGRCAEVAR